MPVFHPGKVIVTTQPFVVVDAGLPPGRHRFHLVVENERGELSQPDEFILIVRASIPRVVPPSGPTGGNHP